MGDRIAVMNRHGEIAQVATPQDVYKRPVNMFVAGFIGTPQHELPSSRSPREHERAASGDRQRSSSASGRRTSSSGSLPRISTRIRRCSRASKCSSRWAARSSCTPPPPAPPAARRRGRGRRPERCLRSASIPARARRRAIWCPCPSTQSRCTPSTRKPRRRSSKHPKRPTTHRGAGSMEPAPLRFPPRPHLERKLTLAR